MHNIVNVPNAPVLFKMGNFICMNFTSMKNIIKKRRGEDKNVTVSWIILLTVSTISMQEELFTRF